MEYDLKNLRPSQERRIASALQTDDGRAMFAQKLGHFLSDRPLGGEAELDQTTSLATRLTALQIWQDFSTDQLRSIGEKANRNRLSAFRKGLPTEVASKLRRVVHATREHAPVVGGKRDEWIARYAQDLRQKAGIEPDMDLLTKITIACGPSIYQPEMATISATSDALEKIKSNFLVGRLGLPDSPNLMYWINSVIDQYGRTDRNKYRAVIHYLLIDQLSNDESTVEWVQQHSKDGESAQKWLTRT